MTAWVTIDSDAVDGVELHTDGVPEFLTPPRARELAAALLEAAGVVEDVVPA